MSRQILLVEDDPDDEALFLRAYQSLHLDCPLTVARDGQQAVDIITADQSPQGSTPPLAFALLDLKLPKIDGFCVLERVRQELEFQSLPLIVFSSSAEVADIQRSYQLGANAYVQKPSSLKRLRHTIASIIDFWLDTNLNAPSTIPPPSTHADPTSQPPHPPKPSID